MSELKTVDDWRQAIKRECHYYVGIRPYSHNMISIALRAIHTLAGAEAANRAIIDFKLERLGWKQTKTGGSRMNDEGAKRLLRAIFCTDADFDVSEECKCDLGDALIDVQRSYIRPNAEGRRNITIMVARFGLNDGKPETIEGLSTIWEVNKSRIQQIELTALRRLRHPSHSDNLKKYMIERREE